MQHFQREKTSKATQLTFYGKSSIYSWRGKIFFCDLRWDVVENLSPSWRKEIMNEEATTVQATQPPSSLPELIFRRFCFSSKLDLGKPSILKKRFFVKSPMKQNIVKYCVFNLDSCDYRNRILSWLAVTGKVCEIYDLYISLFLGGRAMVMAARIRAPSTPSVPTPMKPGLQVPQVSYIPPTLGRRKPCHDTWLSDDIDY